MHGGADQGCSVLGKQIVTGGSRYPTSVDSCFRSEISTSRFLTTPERYSNIFSSFSFFFSKSCFRSARSFCGRKHSISVSRPLWLLQKGSQGVRVCSGVASFFACVSHLTLLELLCPARQIAVVSGEAQEHAELGLLRAHINSSFCSRASFSSCHFCVSLK